MRPFHYEGFKEFVSVVESAALFNSIKNKDDLGESIDDPKLIDCPEDDKDNQLQRSFEVLTSIHHSYYSELDKQSDHHEMRCKLSTSKILNSMKRCVLAGCAIVFASIFPKLDPPSIEKQPLWRYAIALGAVVTHEVMPFTTHLITLQANSAKAKQCISSKSVFLVHPDWLLSCMWNVARTPESHFCIHAMPTVLPSPIDLPENADENNLGKRKRENEDDNEDDNEDESSESEKNSSDSYESWNDERDETEKRDDLSDADIEDDVFSDLQRPQTPPDLSEISTESVKGNDKNGDNDEDWLQQMESELLF